MSKRRIAVKIGGSTLGQHDTTAEDLVWLQAKGYEPVVVHGGGKAITDWLGRAGIESRFVDGLRVTDEASIDIVVAVLAGLVNKRLVASINALGGRAVGLCGADGPIAPAVIKDPGLGLVGEPSGADPHLLEALIASGFIPVIAPIGIGEKKAGVSDILLNINADTFAADIGGAIGAGQFVFLTDVPGVRNERGEALPRLQRTQLDGMIATGVISGGMIPKVQACLRALERVPEALIVDGRASHALRTCVEGTLVGTRIQ